MYTEFSTIDVELIEKEVTRKSHADIAFLIDKPVEEVAAFIGDYFKDKGIITFQEVQKKPRERMPSKPKEKKKDVIITSRRILKDRSKRPEPKFQTKKVDYSKMTSVRIDDKTMVYLKPGQTTEQAKAKYKKLMKEHTALKPIEKFYNKRADKRA
jgi:hypothetical protein